MPGEPSETVTWEAVAAAEPEVVVVMPCGYDAPRAHEEALAHAERLRALGARAGRRGQRLGLLLAARAAARRRARAARALLHPELLADVPLDGRRGRVDARSAAAGPQRARPGAAAALRRAQAKPLPLACETAIDAATAPR